MANLIDPDDPAVVTAARLTGQAAVALLIRRCEEHAKPVSKHSPKIQALLTECAETLRHLVRQRDAAYGLAPIERKPQW